MSSKSSKRWRSAFGPDEVIQRIRPEYTDEFLNNPHKGCATFQRFNGDPLYPGVNWDDEKGPLEFPPPKNRDLSNDRYPPTRIAYCRWLWSVLEPKKGRMRWDVIDGALKTAAERGQTLQMRTQPYIGNLTPAWYWKTGAKRGPDGGPDHNDPLYLKHWGDHIRALGRRYDGHPALESFDMAYGGPCGEMGGNAAPRAAARLMDIYLESFKKTTLVAMLGTPGAAYVGRQGKRSVGWRADGFMDAHFDGKGVVPDHLCWNHMYDNYPREVEENGLANAWRTAPVTLETYGSVPSPCYEKKYDLDWILDQGYKYHATVFMPKSIYIPEAWMSRIMEFCDRIGYRFFLQQMILPLEAKPGQAIELQATVINKGVAPIYRPYRFALRFMQGKQRQIVALQQDIRKWLPGMTFFRERFVFPTQLRNGEVSVACAIVDDAGRPVVKLAVKEIDNDGWHPLTMMDVV